jgi:hypothetical protein
MNLYEASIDVQGGMAAPLEEYEGKLLCLIILFFQFFFWINDTLKLNTLKVSNV